jgi:drug/metabolite transporter (DMT)-like permease
MVARVAAVLALLSSALWGSADFLGGLTTRRLPAIAVVGWSQAIAFVAVTVAAAVSVGFGGPTGWVPWSMVAGIAGAGGLVAFYSALATGTMGVVAPIAALGAIVPVMGGVLTGETPSGGQIVGMALGLAGAVAASGPELSGRELRSAQARSIVLAVVAGLLFGFSLLGIQRGAATSPLLTMVGMRSTSLTIFLVIALVVRSTGGVRRRDLPLLAVIGISDVGANLLLAVASTMGLLSVTAVLGSLYPVVTVLLGAAVLHERILMVQRVGVVLAVGGIALLAAG